MVMTKNRWSSIWLALLFILSLLIGGCGGDDEAGGAALEGVSPNVTVTPAPTVTVAADVTLFGGLPEPVRGTLALPELPDFDARIIFVREETLYLAAFDGQAPLVLDEAVSATTLSVAPGDDLVAYSVNDPALAETYGIMLDAYDLRLLDLRTYDTTIYAPDASTQMALPVLGWLDGTTVASWDRTINSALLLNAGGATTVPILGPFGYAWTPEGHLLYIGEKPGTGGGNTRVGTVFEVDPAAGDPTIYDFTLATPPEMDFMNLEAGLQDQGAVYADTYTQKERSALLDNGARAVVLMPAAVQRGQPRICDTWEIVQRARDGATTDTLLVHMDDTAYLTDLAVLPDGTLLFLRWHIPGCDITADMSLDLMQLAPGAEPEVLATGLDPGAQGGFNVLQSLNVARGHKYDVSADGRYVIWVSGGRTAEFSTLHILDLDTGDSAALMSLPVELSGAGSIETVYWVLP